MGEFGAPRRPNSVDPVRADRNANIVLGSGWTYCAATWWRGCRKRELETEWQRSWRS